jgi:hypothetical protein
MYHPKWKELTLQRFFDFLDTFLMPSRYERHILRLKSFREIVIDTYGIPTRPLTGPENEDPFWTTGIFQTSNFGRCLYSSGAGADIPVISKLP